MRSHFLNRLAKQRHHDGITVDAFILVGGLMTGLALSVPHALSIALAWAFGLILIDHARTYIHKSFGGRPSLSMGAIAFIFALRALADIWFLSLPCLMLASDSAGTATLGFLFICAGVLRAGSEVRHSGRFGNFALLSHVIIPTLFLIYHISADDMAGKLDHGLQILALALFVAHTLLTFQRRDRAELALHDAHDAAAMDAALAKVMSDHTGLRIALFDQAGRFVMMNKVWLEALGGNDVKDVLGKTLQEVTPNVPQYWLDCVRRALAGETIVHQGEKRHQPNGAVRILDWEIRPWRAENGTILGAVTFARDVTELHEARAAELDNLRRLEIATGALDAIIWEVDIPNKSVTFGPNSAQPFGRPHTFDDVFPGPNSTIHESDAEHWESQTQAILANGGRGMTEIRHIMPDGSTRWIRSFLTPALDENGQVDESMDRFVVLSRDVTEEVAQRNHLGHMLAKAQQALHQRHLLLADVTGHDGDSEPPQAANNDEGHFSELIERLDQLLGQIEGSDVALATAITQLRAARLEAEAASDAKSQFLANMSHELRTPLNGIIGFAEILLEDMTFAENASAAKDAGRIIRSARTLLTLINNVLDSAKVESGRMGVEMAPVSTQTMIADVVELVEASARENGNKIAYHIAPGAPSLLVTDGLRMRQCLTNIIGNAAKFTREGDINISVKPYQDGRGDWLEVAVADTGIGIDEAAQTGLFNRFTQADGSTTRRFGGTGLGLALTRDLMGLMGGTISLASTAGEGSVFTLRWPVRSPVTESDHPDHKQISNDVSVTGEAVPV